MAGSWHVVQSSVSLVHRGLIVERPPGDRPGVDGGVSLAWLAPRADHESWRGTLVGLGRDDAWSGTASLRLATARGGSILRGSSSANW